MDALKTITTKCDFKAMFAILIFLCSCSSYACQFNTDCDVGSKCVKARSGSINGVCMGGMNPGNKHDRRPVYDPMDINGTTGNTCQFNVDCGPGSKCVKSRGSINGVCLR